MLCLELLLIGLQLHLLDQHLRRRRWRLLRWWWLFAGVFPEVAHILETGVLHQLCLRVVNFHRVNQRLAEWGLRHGHLRLEDGAKVAQLHVLVARSQSHIDRHVIRIAPLLRVIFHKFIPKTEGNLLHVAFGQQLENALKNGLHKTLGHDAGNQLDAHLARIHQPCRFAVGLL